MEVIQNSRLSSVGRFVHTHLCNENCRVPQSLLLLYKGEVSITPMFNSLHMSTNQELAPL